MKRTRSPLLFAAGVLALGIALTQSNPINLMRAQGSVDPNVEGTWRVQVTPDGGPPFRALATFGSGGTVVESSEGSNDKGGQGVWKRTGGRTFGFTVEQFQFDNAGNFIGTLKLRESDRFMSNSDTYDGVGMIEFRNPDGTLAYTVCARTHGTRMAVEAPDCR